MNTKGIEEICPARLKLEGAVESQEPVILRNVEDHPRGHQHTSVTRKSVHVSSASSRQSVAFRCSEAL